MLFETHAHYDDTAFDADRDELLQKLDKNGINYVVNIGASLESTRSSIELAEKYPYFYAAIGVHPNEAAELDEQSFDWLKKLTAHKKVVAIGEIGLDYHWETPDRETQKLWFRNQMDLAAEMGLPIIIHSRDAAQDTYDMIVKACLEAENQGKKLRGVMHCFSYGSELAEKFIGLGFYLGIGGVVTFKNAKKLKEVVKSMPLESLVLETDCPYLAPEPFRGKRNSSLYLELIAKAIAEIKALDVQEVMDATLRNAKRLYGMDK